MRTRPLHHPQMSSSASCRGSIKPLGSELADGWILGTSPRMTAAGGLFPVFTDQEAAKR